jgi:PAS domain S-box-containing protein
MNNGKQIGGAKWLFIAALWVPLIFTLILAFLAYWGQHFHDVDSRWVLHTVEVKDQLGNLDSLVKDVENNERGYLLTGNANFLAAYKSAVQKIAAQDRELSRLVADNPSQVAAATHLRMLIGDELATAATSLALVQQGRNTDAIELVKSGRGLHENEITAQVDAMGAEEDELLITRKSVSASQVVTQNNLMAGLVAMDLALILAVTLLMMQLQKWRRKAEARTLQAMEQTQEANTQTDVANTQTDQANTRTEQAEAREEEATRVSEFRYRRLFEAARDGILVLDAGTGQVVDANPFMKELLGYSQEEILGRKLWEIGPFKGVAASKITFGELQHADLIHYEGLPLETKDGRRVEVEFISNAYLVGEKRLIQCNIRDITERKRNEARFRRLLDSNAQGVYFWNTDGRVTGGNDAFLTLVRYTREDLEAGRIGWSAMTPPEYSQLDRRSMAEIASGGVCTPFEKEFIRKDGSRVPILIGAAAFEDNPQEGVSFALDLTERKAAEGQIAEQAALLDKAQDGILVRDLDGNILFWSKGAERMYGWARGEVIGRNVCDFYYADPNKFRELNKLALNKGEWHGELEHVTKDGRKIDVEGRWTVISDDKGHPKSVLVINTDVTEKKNIESRFMRAQRMESIGTLAGGIAHDLNNILAPIMMAIEILKSTSRDPQAKSILETIEVSARRGADIVRQVLSFARGVDGTRVEVQPKHLLRDIESIIKNTFPKNIKLRFAIPNDTWTILGDPTQVHQILLNLCVNARDAMPDGGSLTIGVDNCVLDGQHSTLTIEPKPGRYVHISVTDSGVGIPKDILDKIFEPFFTTKELDKGTGLGLSTVMGIVKSHEGNINVYSEPGKGSTFNVYLPSMEMSSEARREQVDEASMPRGNEETVLVVDDEASILSIATQTLQAFGYRVLTAVDGAEAVAVYAQHRHEIAVVITDMSMPVMNGASTISVLARINPAIKIIAASGLGASAGGNKNAGPNVKHFLTKPYTAGCLLKAIRAILDES